MNIVSVIKSKIEKIDQNQSKEVSSVKFKYDLKEETNMEKCKEVGTTHTFFEGIRNETGFPGNTTTNWISKCKKCSYASENADLFKLHIISHDIHGPELFQKLPKYLRNRQFTSQEEFKEELEKFLVSI